MSYRGPVKCGLASLRLVLVAAVAGLWATQGAWAQEIARAPELSQVGQRITPIDIEIADLPTFDARTGIMYSPVSSSAGLRGTCPLEVRTHSSANFSGGQFVLQAGMVEGEALTATYTVAQSEFPVRIDLMEFILATQNAQVQTTTHYTVLIWAGLPTTGVEVGSFSSDGIILQPVVLGPGTTGANLAVSVDPGDPEQIIISSHDANNVQLPHCNGSTCSFSVGLRIEQHNNPPSACCSLCLLPAPCCPPPTASNAFPTTDTARPSLANARTQNWLYCLPGCTVFGIGCGDGWHRFDQMDPDLEPGGDWNIRVSYTSLACQVGACCGAEGTCSFESGAACLAAGGLFQGDNTGCEPNPCPQPSGACCTSGICLDGISGEECTGNGVVFLGVGTECETSTCPFGACCAPSGCTTRTSGECALVPNGLFQGVGSSCEPNMCPDFTQACCFEGNPPSCSNLVAGTCDLFGGVAQGVSTTCATTNCFPTGACCMPLGTCADAQSPEDCAAAGGSYQGNNSTCGGTSCPQPTGACCVGANCAQLLQADCTPIPGASWAGPLTTCPSACATTGACCLGDTCSVTSEASCAAQGYVCDVAALLPASFADCHGDADGNGVVNAGDRGFISASIGQTDDDTVCRFDMDGNGLINAGDRGFVSANIGLCSPLPNFQNGSGLNAAGTGPDPRYPSGQFQGNGTTCASSPCD
jgi:hypothetical protein